MASIVKPSEVTEGDRPRHLVTRKGLPVGGAEGYVPRGAVVETRTDSVSPYGVPATYLKFEDGHEAGPFIPRDRFALANR